MLAYACSARYAALDATQLRRNASLTNTHTAVPAGLPDTFTRITSFVGVIDWFESFATLRCAAWPSTRHCTLSNVTTSMNTATIVNQTVFAYVIKN